MNPYELAAKHLQPFKVSGSEIVPLYCPFCHGGGSKDKNTFAMHTTTGTYNCKRGSCDVSGTFNQLLREFGEVDKPKNYDFQRPKKKFKPPATKPETASEKVAAYLQRRGFSPETWQKLGVGEHKGAIAMPYYENGRLVLMKFRPAHKPKDGEKKGWREEGGKAVFWQMDKADASKPLIITEGECFPGDVEVLTPSGWIRLDKYNGDDVLQINEDLTSSFVQPLAYVNKKFTGDLLRVDRGGNYVTMTTPDHNLVYVSNNKIKKLKACEMPLSVHGYIPTTTTLNGTGIQLTNDQIALCLAISADGALDIRKDNRRYVRMAFAKQRKIDRMAGILKRLNIKYAGSLNSDGKTSFCFNAPLWFPGKILPGKWIGLATTEQRRFILDEMVYWDGNKVINRRQTEYATKIYHNAVFMQTIAHTCGIMSTVMKRKNKFGEWYKVSILHGKNTVSWQKTKPQKVSFSGYVHCVTVPSGMILVRQEGHITISGNCDTMAIFEAGLDNAVSVPSGAEDLTCVDNCWEWLQRFKRVTIWTDNDEPGQGLQRNLIQRLGAWRCSVVQHERKDANEVLLFDGRQAVVDAVKNAVEVPINGLIRLGDVKPFDYSNATRINSGIRGIDNAIGGFITTQVTLWTGDNSAGKSTLLGQVMLEAVEQKFPLCCYSGELAAPIFKYWAELQAAGPNWLEEKHDPVKNGPIYSVKREAIQHIRNWYRDYFYLCDSFGGIKEDNLFELFEYAAMRYGCRVFVIDNLMTVDANSRDEDYYRNQAQFLNNVMNFAHTHDCHIHLVAHPRKAQGKITKDDVKGAKDLTNRVDNVIAVHRLSEKERQEYGCVSTAEILKNRLDGQQDIEIQLKFDDRCKRFSMATDTVPKKYGWELTTSAKLQEVEALFNES